MSKETHNIDIIEKLKKLEEENMKLSVEVNYKAQDNNRLNDELIAKTEEIKYYESIIQNTSSISLLDSTRGEDAFLLKKSKLEGLSISEDLNIENINNNQNEDDEENLIIFNQLEGLLRETTQNANDIPLTNSNSINLESFNLFCRAVMIIFVDPDTGDEFRKPQFFIQTFKIDLLTTFLELKKGIFNFWDLKDRENDFSLKFMDENGETYQIKDDEEIIDTYLKSKSNMKKAKFIFMPQKLKNYKDYKSAGDIKGNENIKNFNKITIDSTTEKFFSKFLGLSNYLTNKFINIKKKKERKENNTVITSKGGEWVNKVISIFKMLLLISITSFTVVSLLIKNPENKSYMMIQSVKEKFNPTGITKGYLTKETVIDDIIKRVKGISYEGDHQSDIRMMSKMRISFYRVKEKSTNCLHSDEICYNESYNSQTAATSDDTLYYFQNEQYKNLTIFDENKSDLDLSKYFIKSNDETINYNQASTLLNLYEYYKFILNPLISINSSLNQYIKGKLGTYTGNSYDLYVNIHTLSSDVLKTLLYITTTDSLLWDKGLRSILVSFTLFHFQSNYYFYVNLLYEMDTDGAVLPVIVDCSYFHTNVYLGVSGNLMNIFDILRLVFVILLFLILIKDVLYERRKLLLKEPQNYSIFEILFDTKIIFEITSIIIYFVSFYLKRTFLNDSAILYWFDDISNPKLVQIYQSEFFWIIEGFILDLLLESILCFLLACRLFMFFSTLKRIRGLAFFIVHSFKKLISFFIITLTILSCLAVYAQNLLGADDDSFSDFTGSLNNVLMFSIGHFRSKSIKYNIWFIIFLFLLIFVGVYFILSNFIGFYLESFRINSIRKGYSFDNRKKKKNKEDLLKITDLIKKNNKN